MDKTKEQERDFIISFEVIQLEKKTITQFFNIWENLQENHQKTVFLAYFGNSKSKFLIIHAATYITVFLLDSNNFLLYVVSCFNISLHYFLIFLLLFQLVFLNLLPRGTFYNLAKMLQCVNQLG